METFFKMALAVLLFFVFGVSLSLGGFTSCLGAYEQGGAPAVIQSPACSHFILPTSSFQNETDDDDNCLFGTGMLRDPEKYKSSDMFCDLDMHIPFLGKEGLEDARVGMVAMFDAYDFEDSTKLATKLLKDYFLVHAFMLHDGIYAINKHIGTLPYHEEKFIGFRILDQDEVPDQLDLKLGRSGWSLLRVLDDTTRGEILKEALSRAIHDIDLTLSAGHLNSTHIPGCVATVVLMVEGQILVHNGCNSKPLVITEKFWRDWKHWEDEGTWVDLSTKNSSGSHYNPQSHDQPDQSQSDDDAHLSRYDTMIAPEPMDWRPLNVDENWLIIASSPIFERLSQRSIYKFASAGHLLLSPFKYTPSCDHDISLADCIADAAYIEGNKKGRAYDDNLSVAVVYLKERRWREPVSEALKTLSNIFNEWKKCRNKLRKLRRPI